MKSRLVAALVVLAGSLLFQSWFLGLWPNGQPLADAQLSTLYTRALADGRSHLSTAVNPHLKDAPDPFAPELAPYRTDAPLDVSIYRGHYYLYFGIVPFVALFVPWTILTGSIPTPGAAILCFCCLGYLAYGGLLLTAAARWFPKARGLLFAAAFAALIASSGTWPLMSRPAIYEVENAAAFASFGAALFFLLQADGGNARRGLAQAAAAACAALCLGCRPNYFPAVMIIGAVVLLRAWRLQPGLAAFSRAARTALVMAPLIAIGLGLAWWNDHRFDNILDFGLKHTVSNDPAAVRPLASWSNLPYGLHRYALGAARLIRYFPFIQGQQPGPFALGPVQEPSNQVYGFLLVSPILVGAAGFLARGIKLGGSAGRFGMIAALTFAGNFVFLSAVTMSCYRYPADFLGPLATLAACGILGLSTVPGGIPRMVSLSMLPPLLAWSVCALVFQVFSVAQSAELFDVRRPADFARAGSLFNQASYHLEQWRHDGPRGLEITALLPAGRTGQVEPLVVAGDDGALDFLYLNYVTPDDVQIGFEAMGRGGLQSPTVKIDYRQPHRFEVRYGSFLPPDNHPSLRSLSPADRDLARRMITVLLDGRIVMDGWADFHLPRARIFIGESPDNPAFGAAFTGKILGVNRPLLTTIPSPAQLKPGGYGPLAFTAVLQPMPIGVFDPLVSFGQLQQGAQLLVEHLSSTQVRIVWLDTAKREISGEPFIWPAGKKLEVEIEAGSLLPPATSGIWPGNPSPAEKAERKQRLRVSVDGRTVFQVRCEAPEASPATVAVGQDLLALRGGVMPALNEVPAQIRRLPW